MLAPRRTLVVLLALVCSILGCRDKSADVASGERFSGRGKIEAISKNSVDVHHERLAAVRAFDGTIKPMESMTMQFARSATSFDGFAVGDLVEFEFTVHYGEGPTLRLVRIAKLPPGTVLQLP